MDSSSEFSSESDPYHDSDNYDMDPDYVLESESGNKNGRKCFIKLLSNAYSVTDHDKEQDEEINKASTSGINQTPISKHVTAGDNSSSSTEEEHFNLSFGYPRSDTCATCDLLKIQLDAASTDELKQQLKVQKDVHLRKAQALYDDLKEKTEMARTNETVETICFDYQQNLPVPVLTTEGYILC
ncbi:unnamed protein product [Acanthoscelides obtectus]|uniref:Uncharacterized protein n=1 Tax=Acanthoscelides obtectus TaxID=200917 RepID=A0A9P0LJ95_ACAOB|nr:unnamed protein product [Acanthoscelides obtectus]CAK1675730.1 hypothetical protein AOBTE_LOCUS30396 [Acanthoscelides obtectus]